MAVFYGIVLLNLTMQQADYLKSYEICQDYGAQSELPVLATDDQWTTFLSLMNASTCQRGKMTEFYIGLTQTNATTNTWTWTDGEPYARRPYMTWTGDKNGSKPNADIHGSDVANCPNRTCTCTQVMILENQWGNGTFLFADLTCTRNVASKVACQTTDYDTYLTLTRMDAQYSCAAIENDRRREASWPAPRLDDSTSVATTTTAGGGGSTPAIAPVEPGGSTVGSRSASMGFRSATSGTTVGPTAGDSTTEPSVSSSSANSTDGQNPDFVESYLGTTGKVLAGIIGATALGVAYKAIRSRFSKTPTKVDSKLPDDPLDQAESAAESAEKASKLISDKPVVLIRLESLHSATRGAGGGSNRNRITPEPSGDDMITTPSELDGVFVLLDAEKIEHARPYMVQCNLGILAKWLKVRGGPATVAQLEKAVADVLPLKMKANMVGKVIRSARRIDAN